MSWLELRSLEGAAYTLMIKPNPEIERELDEIIDAAQQADGYLSVSHPCGNPNPREMGQTPYSYEVHGHGLYNLGHLYEGATEPCTGFISQT